MLALDHETLPAVSHDPNLAPAPPATLAEARLLRDALARLIGRERHAAADFLSALADFDRRRGWERLGHGSLFAFLTQELGMSKGAAYLRLTAARLLPRHSAVEAALRSGRLCLSAVGELSRVLTPENEAEVLPRFLGRSAREAREVVAELSPCPAPPSRQVVRRVKPTPARAASIVTSAPPLAPTPSSAAPSLEVAGAGEAAPTPAIQAGHGTPAAERRPEAVLTSEPPAAPRPRPCDVEPLTAELHRLHLTVSRRLLDKVAKARDGLSHAVPGATTEQVLEAALDLLLEKQARSRALVKRPRKGRAPGATAGGLPAAAPSAALPLAQAGIPAEVEREVRLRDGDRCQFPLDAGGVCGSTWQVELDHVVPRCLGGHSTAANLRCACSFHNRYAAALALGPAVAGLRRRK